MFASCGPFLVLKSHTATALGMILAALCDANIRTSRFINHDRRSVREQKNIFRYGQVNKGETKRLVQRQFACVHVCVCVKIKVWKYRIPIITALVPTMIETVNEIVRIVIVINNGTDKKKT